MSDSDRDNSDKDKDKDTDEDEDRNDVKDKKSASKGKSKDGDSDGDGDDGEEEDGDDAGDDDDEDNVGAEYSLAEDLKRFIKQDAKNPDKFADVTFLVGDRGQAFNAHRIILAAASPVFAAMLYPNPAFAEYDAKDATALAAAAAEAKKLEDDKLTIIVKDVDPRIFGLLLTCIYTDTAEVEVKNVGEAMAAATKYCVDKLHGVCATFLEEGIRIDNAAQLFQTAPQLLGDNEFGLKFIEENAKAVVESKGFCDLSLDRVATILKSNDLRIKEVDLWSGVMRWGKAQIRLGRTKGETELGKVLAPLIPDIRFPLLTVQEFASTVQGGAQVLSQEQCLQLYTYIAQRESKVPKKHLPKVPYSSEPRGQTCFVFQWAQVGRHGYLSGENLILTSNSGGYCVALGSEAMPKRSGKYYWEVKILNSGAAGEYATAVGVSAEGVPLDNYITNTPNVSWVWYNQGSRCHATTDNNDRFGGAYNTGDTLGLEYDSDAGTLSAWRNKQSVGVMYHNIGDRVVRPSVMVYQGNSVTLVADAQAP